MNIIPAKTNGHEHNYGLEGFGHIGIFKKKLKKADFVITFDRACNLL